MDCIFTLWIGYALDLKWMLHLYPSPVDVYSALIPILSLQRIALSLLRGARNIRVLIVYGVRRVTDLNGPFARHG